MARVGVDVGGTNTDLVLEADHGVYFHKVASTPSDQSDGVLVGLRELCEQADVKPTDIDLIVHGTTVATNVTLENDGAEVGMITTRNFRDILLEVILGQFNLIAILSISSIGKIHFYVLQCSF